jgi:hypothetical protein
MARIRDVRHRVNPVGITLVLVRPPVVCVGYVERDRLRRLRDTYHCPASVDTLGAMRVWTDCGELKPLEAFTRIKGTRWTHTRCKPCRARREYLRTNPGAEWPRPWKALASTRLCSDCAIELPLDAFTPIKRQGGRYGRCRACRARRARERYQANPAARAADIERAKRNNRKRRERPAGVIASSVDQLLYRTNPNQYRHTIPSRTSRSLASENRRSGWYSPPAEY